MEIDETLVKELIIALESARDNAQLHIEMSGRWQATHIIELYMNDIRLAEKLLLELSGG